MGIRKIHSSVLRKLFFVICASIVFNSCKDNPVAPEERKATGSVYITVTDYYGSPAKNVLISTNPATKSGLTDAFGSYLIKDLPVGAYEIAATKSDFGSGKDVVNVEENKVVKLNLMLRPGIFFSYSPIVKITDPLTQAKYAQGDTITFKALVTDNETPAESLSVKWYSSKDGLLKIDKANQKGEISFQTTKLSKDLHIISLIVEDADKNISKDSVVIYNNYPAALKLNEPLATYGSLQLNWSRTAETDFSSYKIYRSTSATSEGEMIYEIFDSNTLSYEDKEILLGKDYYYRIRLELKDGRYSLSNVKQAKAGVSIDIQAQIEKMILDSKRNYLYAIDKVNNNLMFINTNTLKLERKIYVGKTPTDLDIDASGDTLYIANSGSTEISVVDLKSQSKVKSIFVNSRPYQIECGEQGRVIYAEWDQWCRIVLVDSYTGTQLSTSGLVYQPDIEISSNGKSVYAGESGLSGSNIYRFDISNNAFTQVDKTPGYGYSYSQRKLVMSGDGKYLFYSGAKILSANLSSQVGNFAEIIYASNSTGSIAFGQNNIYNGDNFSIKRKMPVNSKIAAITPDDSKVYLYDETSSKIFIYQF